MSGLKSTQNYGVLLHAKPCTCFSLEIPNKRQLHLSYSWDLSMPSAAALGVPGHGVFRCVLRSAPGSSRSSAVAQTFRRTRFRMQGAAELQDSLPRRPAVAHRARSLPSKPAGSLLSDPSHLPSLQITSRPGSQEPAKRIMVPAKETNQAASQQGLAPEAHGAAGFSRGDCVSASTTRLLSPQRLHVSPALLC